MVSRLPLRLQESSRAFWTHRRQVFVVLDQGALSITSFIVLAVAARRLDTADFALTSLVLALLSAVTLGYRVVVLEPTLVPLAQGVDRRPNIVRSTMTWALGAVVVGAVLLATPLPAWPGILCIGIGITCSLDSARVEALAQRRDGTVLMADGLWPVACLMLAGLTSGAPSRDLTVATYVLGAVAPLGVLMYHHAQLLSQKPSAGEWSLLWRPGRHLWREYASTASGGQIVNWAAGGLIGLGPLAGVRGAMLMIGPLNIVYSGLNIVLLRQRRWGARQLSTSALLLQTFVAGTYFAALWLSLLLAPSDLLGDATAGTVDMLPWFTACYLMAPLASSGLIALRFSRKFQKIAGIRVGESVVNIASFFILFMPLSAAAIPVSQGLAYGYTGVRTWREVRRRT